MQFVVRSRRLGTLFRGEYTFSFSIHVINNLLLTISSDNHFMLCVYATELNTWTGNTMCMCVAFTTQL